MVRNSSVGLANVITASRFLLVLAFIVAVVGPGRPWWGPAMAALAAAALTDWLDGHVARRRHEVTEVGRVGDPLADRTLVVSALIVLDSYLPDFLPWWAVATVVAREVLMVAGGFLLLAVRRAPPAVRREGKVASATVMTAIVLRAAATLAGVPMGRALGFVLFLAGLLLSLRVTARYVRDGLSILMVRVSGSDGQGG